MPAGGVPNPAGARPTPGTIECRRSELGRPSWPSRIHEDNGTSRTLMVVLLQDDGRFDLALSDSESRQSHLADAFGTVRGAATNQISVVLVPDLRHPTDHYAVAVYAENGRRLGLLPPGEAEVWQGRLIRLFNHCETYVVCPAEIRGSGSNRLFLDVSLAELTALLEEIQRGSDDRLARVASQAAG